MRKIFFAIAIIFTTISSPKLFAQENRFNGIGEINKQLLQKVEEQMLYIIDLNKKVERLTKALQDLKNEQHNNPNTKK